MKIKLNKTYRIKSKVNHQRIGGKEIYIEKELSLDDVLKQRGDDNVACINYFTSTCGIYS